VSPLLTWEGPGEVPNFCPQGCGGITEDVYGGPCKACWDAAGRAERDEDEHCTWCQRGGEMQGFEGRPFCGEDCANAYWHEWGHDD
jgi:hypothetical protein